MKTEIELLRNVAKAAYDLGRQFKAIRDDHYEKLVHHQTLQSASENWDSLKQGPLEFDVLLKALDNLHNFLHAPPHPETEEL
jgi:hypothetical protein